MNKNDPDYYSRQYNARAMIPEHPGIFARWQQDSDRVRRTHPAFLDLPYGGAEKERLDIFPTRERDAPLLVFIHGGWWRALDKADFSFIAPAYTHAGVNVAITNYTLAPRASLPEIVCEQLRAVAWLYRHAGQYNFDRSRIILAGHSAGAHMAAMLMAALWPTMSPDLPADLVKGAVLMSGVYDLEPVRRARFVNVDLKLKKADVGSLSPVFMPPSHPIPFVTACGGLESDEFKRQSALIARVWQPHHRADIALPDVNHLTMCDAFGTPGHPLLRATMELLRP
jgi:arylformamidase